eukprot:Seg2482.1 transcript_id=Seg2482.1/GoldUCD/mRNA.D3Y31 product="C3a anaphylatoxin chemotactic receptor" protein_id=Seg2482.1/GoldUCD/D3Y31
MAVYFIFQIIWNGAKFFCGRQFLNSTRFQDQCFPVAWNFTSPLFPNCTAGPPRTLQEAMNNTLCMYTENLPKTPPTLMSSEMSSEVSIIFICIYALIFLLGVPGNAMVCIVLGMKKQGNNGDDFIISLATTDFITSVLGPLKVIVILSSRFTLWHFGLLAGEIIGFINQSTLLTSSWSLVLIAFDRYRVITKPMQARVSQKKRLVAIFCTWVLSITVQIPFWFQSKMSDVEFLVLFTIWAFIGWILPFFVIFVLYRRCIKILQKNHFKGIENETMRRRLKENKRVVKMFIIVVSLFFLVTFPFVATLLGINYRIRFSKPSLKTFRLMRITLESLTVVLALNGCLNPFIYAKMHQSFNAFVVKVWKRLKCQKVATPLEMSSSQSRGFGSTDTTDTKL